jgi:hypothetical protein
MFHQALKIGPFLIKYGWIAVIYSIICAYVIMRIRLGKSPSLKEEMVQIFYNSILLYFLVWKFSIILMDPGMLIHNIYGLIYFTGGTFGQALALAAAFFYIFRTYRKKSLPLSPLLDLLSFAAITGFIAYAIQYYFLFRT